MFWCSDLHSGLVQRRFERFFKNYNARSIALPLDPGLVDSGFDEDSLRRLITVVESC